MTPPRRDAPADVTIDPPGGKVIRGEIAGEGPRVLLSRDAILKADDLSFEDVEVPEWGGSVRVRALSGHDRDEFEASMATMRGKKLVPDTENIRAKLVARCLIDEQGDPMFSQRDVWELGKKSAAALDRIFEVASRLSGLDADDIEELEGNSAGDQNGGSTSS